MIPWYWLIPGGVSFFALMMCIREPQGNYDWAGFTVMVRLFFWGFIATLTWALFFFALWCVST